MPELTTESLSKAVSQIEKQSKNTMPKKKAWVLFEPEIEAELKKNNVWLEVDENDEFEIFNNFKGDIFK